MKKYFLATLVFSAVCLNAQTLADAIKLSENEQYETATLAFEKLIAGNASDGANYYYLGENYLANDNIDKAKETYQKGTTAAPASALNYVGLGKLAYLQNNVADANANFFKAKTLSQNKNASVLMEIAELYINADVKNISEAITLLNQAAKLEPKNPTIYTLLGDAYLEQNDGNQAIANYEKALDIDKKFTKAILREGKLYSRAKNYNLALDYYNKAINIDSTYAPAFRERAELRFRAGQADRAAADYQKYLKLNDNVSARIRYASFKYVSKDYATAVSEITEIQKKDNSDINLYRLLGYSYSELKKYPEGLSNMETFMSKATASGKKILATDYEYLGKTQMNTGKDSLGTMNLLKAISIDSTRTDLYADLASGCLKAKKYPCAITYYEKKISVSKNKVGGANDYFGLGRAFYFNKEYVKADSAFAQLTRLQPNLPYGYFWRGRCNSQFDLDSKKGLAKPFYQLHVEKVGADVEKNKKDLVESYEYLAYQSMITKDSAKAKELWNKVKELDPANEKAKKALADPSLK